MANSGGRDSCIFCKIIDGKIPSERVHEDAEFICIRDIQPQAKRHLLVVPKEHIPTLEDAFPDSGPQRPELVARMFEVATRVARAEGLLPAGFRSVINTHAAAGQTVFHLHLHVLGGERLQGRFA